MADTKVFLSGGRIQGRSDDTAIGTTPQTSWKFLKKETLDAAATTITVTDFAVKDNLMILYFAKDRSNRLNMHFGNTSLDPDIDVNGNYAVRRNYDYTYTSGGGDATETSETDGRRVSDELIEEVLGHPRSEDFKNSILMDDRKNIGHFGCFLSHIGIFQEFMKSDKPYCIIFEDDAEFKTDTFKRDVNRHMGNVPDDWDIVLLGFHTADDLHYGKNQELI